MNDRKELFDPIGEKVLKIRRQYVLLDRDLSGLYGVDTKRLNEAVKRNIERFDEDFMFQITYAEYNEILRSQFATSRWGGLRYMPFAFTELGISMLSSVLNSDVAIRVNKQIMRYFVHMRKLELTSNDFRKYVETKFKLLDEKLKVTDNNVIIQNEIIKDILDQIRRMVKPPAVSKKQIGFRKE